MPQMQDGGKKYNSISFSATYILRIEKLGMLNISYIANNTVSIIIDIVLSIWKWKTSQF